MTCAKTCCHDCRKERHCFGSASSPCQDRITSDENAETYILTVGDIRDMLALLETAHAARKEQG